MLHAVFSDNAVAMRGFNVAAELLHDGRILLANDLDGRSVAGDQVLHHFRGKVQAQGFHFLVGPFHVLDLGLQVVEQFAVVDFHLGLEFAVAGKLVEVLHGGLDIGGMHDVDPAGIEEAKTDSDLGRLLLLGARNIDDIVHTSSIQIPLQI